MVLKIGNNGKVRVEHIRVIFLFLFTSHVLELKKIVFVPSMRRNLISMTCLDQDGYSCLFGNNNFKLYYDSSIARIITLNGGLNKIDSNHVFENSINIIVGNKRKRFDETSLMLQHRGLIHIFKERMERLIKERVLLNRNFLNFGIYVNCVQIKLTI